MASLTSAEILAEAAQRLAQPGDLIKVPWRIWTELGRPGGRRLYDEEVLGTLYRLLPQSKYDSRSNRVRLRDFATLAPIEESRELLRHAAAQCAREAVIVGESPIGSVQEVPMQDYSNIWSKIGGFFEPETENPEQQIRSYLQTLEPATLHALHQQVNQLNSIFNVQVPTGQTTGQGQQRTS